MGLALALVGGLAACEAAGTLAGGGTQSDYLVARQALETGNYDLAIRHYSRLMDGMDAQRAARLQLEYAHALLRGDRFQQAAQAADPLIASNEGSIRASALAVRGTARHEAARTRMAEGQTDAETRALLEGARDDLAAFLAQHAALDTSGSMRARTQLISADLQTLG
jgi:tetratricopeptide (TPR) repeat protein